MDQTDIIRNIMATDDDYEEACLARLKKDREKTKKQKRRCYDDDYDD